MSRHHNTFLKTHGFTCLAGLFLLLVIKFYYSRADSDGLLWILAPTAWWVRTLSGISFAYLPHIGYVNHDFRFVIAASCSGVQFWIIAASLLLFAFLPRIHTQKRGLIWLVTGFLCSYAFTILVNGFRILLSLYLPLYLSNAGMFQSESGWLSPKRLHTVIGVFVYFGSLLFLFFITESWFSKSGCDACPPYPASDSFTHSPMDCRAFSAIRPDKCFLSISELMLYHLRWLLPALWYLAVVLGLPLLNRAYQRDPLAFREYTLTILLVCFPMLLLFRLLQKLLSPGKHS